MCRFGHGSGRKDCAGHERNGRVEIIGGRKRAALRKGVPGTVVVSKGPTQPQVRTRSI